jgi:hypothetical protein
MSNPVRFALIGTGNIAGFHAEAIKQVPAAQLVAAFSRGNPGPFAEKYGCAAVTSLDALLARPDVDAVCITTPSGAHGDPAIAAMKAGKTRTLRKAAGDHRAADRRHAGMCKGNRPHPRGGVSKPFWPGGADGESVPSTPDALGESRLRAPTSSGGARRNTTTAARGGEPGTSMAAVR